MSDNHFPLYSMLRDHREQPLGALKWSGNQRWIAVEQDTPLTYTFQTCPQDEDDAELDTTGTLKMGVRRLFALTHRQSAVVKRVTYVPDGCTVETDQFTFQQTFPWGEYAALLSLHSQRDFTMVVEPYKTVADVMIKVTSDGPLLLRSGLYSLWFVGDGIEFVVNNESQIEIRIFANRDAQMVIAFHQNADEARRDAERLLNSYSATQAASAAHWESYLQSCPVHTFDNDYQYHDTFLDRDVIFSRDELITRQYWHWWALMANVADSRFCVGAPYLSPDRAIWFGSWSNDTPDALCALALTNQRDLARQCILKYLETALDEDSNLGWYTHSYGRSCLGHTCDSGFYSHGLPSIAHCIAYYVEATDDLAVLGEILSSKRSVWDCLKDYMDRVFKVRDPNQDGLVEWSNLWETGWDNKAGAFFSKASITDWVTVVSRNDPQEVARFYQENSRPVTALVEQVFFLEALAGLHALAEKVNDEPFATLCESRLTQIIGTIEGRHWNPQTRFFHDWNVTENSLSDSKNLDAFYLLPYISRTKFAQAVSRHLKDAAQFGLYYTPTLSVSDPAFDPSGYWKGAHWPRESFRLGLTVHAAGETRWGERIVLKALCCQAGSSIPETLDAFTGKPASKCHTMAYSVCLNLAILELFGVGQVRWDVGRMTGDRSSG